VPSDKRARQRAQRQIKVAQQQQRAKRRKALRRIVGGVLVVGVVIGLVVLLSGSKTPAKKAATTTTVTTTTVAGPTTTTIPSVKTAIAPVCPPAGGSVKRYIAFTKAPPICISKIGVYDARVVTDVGAFVIQMPAAYSLTAVNNFIFLARYHFYDSTIFHRVIPGFAVQGGDPTGTGSGGPGYSWTGNTPNSSCAAKNDCYPLYSVAVANSGTPSSNGSQFFIVVGTQGEQLAPNYSLFGKVVSGTAVVQHIAADGNSVTADNGVPPKVVHHIVSITVTPVTT
jgi:cyclophilin family peptidyl-prolyl cis-trans isomerase